MRAALYARYSTELQNVGSIADQFAACRRHADRLGAEVVAEFSDAAISGTVANRPGLLNLLAKAKAGAFDVVIAEALDRLSRSGGGTWDVFEDLASYGVRIHTISEGQVEELAVGLKGTMNALLVKEIGRKTKRGLKGVARDGRVTGGSVVYGYRKLAKLDERGEPIRGLREIDPDKAAVVRRIFDEYVAGFSPRDIAARLNRDAIPAPRGGLWGGSQISGSVALGNGVLHNALYRGEIVFGRRAFTKDRRTGTRRAGRGDPGEIERQTVEELRIVPEDLWTAAQARHASVSTNATGKRPEDCRRPKHLLSGLLKCGVCKGNMTASGPQGRFVCTTRRDKGACENARTIKGALIEERVVAAIRENLLHPDAVEAAVREFQAAAKARKASARSKRSSLESALAETDRRIARLLSQVEEGALPGSVVKPRMQELVAKKGSLEAELAQEPSDVVELHPNAAARYRQWVEKLTDNLAKEDTAERLEAREAIRALVSEIVVTPGEAHGSFTLEIKGDLGPALMPEVRVTHKSRSCFVRSPNIPVIIAA